MREKLYTHKQFCLDLNRLYYGHKWTSWRHLIWDVLWRLGIKT